MTATKSITCSKCDGSGVVACPQCGGAGQLEVENECKRRGCPNEAVYHYHNKISGSEGDYCAEHLEGLRADVSIETWLEGGFAQPIKNASRYGAKSDGDTDA